MFGPWNLRRTFGSFGHQAHNITLEVARLLLWRTPKYRLEITSSRKPSKGLKMATNSSSKNYCEGCKNSSKKIGDYGTPLCAICKEVVELSADKKARMLYVQTPGEARKFVRMMSLEER
jgi:hypothetical protein